MAASPSASDLDRLFAQIKREKGRLDVLFANAGIAKYARLGEITEELYDAIFGVNVKGLLFTVQKALPLLTDHASIILNASIVGSKGLSSNSVYSATKAAVRSFARTWTTDLKHRRIRVNAVSPGSTDTPGLATCWLPARPAKNAGTRFQTALRLVALARRMKSRGPWYFLRLTTAATSRVRNCSLMAALLRYRGVTSPRRRAASTVQIGGA